MSFRSKGGESRAKKERRRSERRRAVRSWARWLDHHDRRRRERGRAAFALVFAALLVALHALLPPT